MQFLDSIDIYGWEQSREDMVLAALVARLNTLIMGDKGMGKTLTPIRVFEALDVACRAKGLGEFEATKVDGHSANEEDLVGYPLPPDEEEMMEARENDDPIEMKTALSPNTIAHSQGITIDEATRIPVHMQSRFLGVMEEGIVDGRELDVEYLFGAANPISYQGTEEMDEALADRWEFIIPAPKYEEMPAEDRQKIIKTRAMDTHDQEPDEEASVRLLEFIKEAREAYNSAVKNDMDRVAQYVDNVACLVNRGVRGNTTPDDPDIEVNTSEYNSTAPLGARRNAILFNNLFALHAVSLARGDDRTIADCGRIAIQHSLVHELHGSDPIPAEAIKVAHDTHSGLLQSQEERVLSMIENKEEPVERAKMALRLRARTEDTSRYVEEAHDAMRENDEDIRQHAFSYVLYNQLQNGDEGLHDLINSRVMDVIVEDVKDVMEAAGEFSITESDVHQDMGDISEFQSLLSEIKEKKNSPRGRAILSFAIYAESESEDSGSERTNPLNAASETGKTYRSIVSRVVTCEDAIEEMAGHFEDLSAHQHALDRS